MSYNKRKAIIDDGMNPELVVGADFDGYLGIPIIHKPDKFIIPSDIIPFTKKGRVNNSNVAIGTYGCFMTRDDKYHFEAGLAAMMETLEPEIVLVYGSMNKKVFGPYLDSAHFVKYPDWITRVKGGVL